MVNYVGKLCLAPMVRSGELPNRIMSLKYGADLVWSPEIVDRKLIQTRRVVNEEIKTVDYVVDSPHGAKLVFRTFPELEAGKLILQLGSSDPDLAVQAAEKVIKDVDGIDLNCGCPKSFSTHSGMGAALLSTPELLCSVLRDLVQKVGIPNQKPISCKIRLLDDLEATRSLVDQICETGIANLTIHCRQRAMRNRQEPIWHYLSEIIPRVQSKGISVVINGNLQSKADLCSLQDLFNNKDIGGMIAEAAEANPSVFSDSPLTQDKLISEFYGITKTYGDVFAGSKFMMLNQIPGRSPFYRQIAQTRTYEDMEKIVHEIQNDKEDKFIHKILNKDLQKQRCVNGEEFAAHMVLRKEVMQRLVGNNKRIAVESGGESSKRSKLNETKSAMVAV
ncbi:predicted protein [Scheffersomyces stipitis CBS 6054]|uniref:DUS-like FMN-binding domain-containing protein n=1 Tax=Scheffersomyces stipitis (strain ATCC 58785 / CBS 6054 / NBRC 10063 / NRRL Y-11545) TaxID=322104 RepID=A3LU67_PICST|nr:predicted protein [Scheffersomyces stipitis CBS 6054]ABN66531.2 predicted protein [Scheffersomyces stipitis CBS 6054]KAG2732929.1 hypothetical protein G9P44_003919 [Scheffersomyces stipitis]